MPIYMKIIGLIGLALLFAGTLNWIYFGGPTSLDYVLITGSVSSSTGPYMSTKWRRYHIGWPGKWKITYRTVDSSGVNIGDVYPRLTINGEDILMGACLKNGSSLVLEHELKAYDRVKIGMHGTSPLSGNGLLDLKPIGMLAEWAILFGRRSVIPFFLIGGFVSVLFIRYLYCRFHAFRWADEKKEMRMKKMNRKIS